jgi:hypothetical protein
LCIPDGVRYSIGNFVFGECAGIKNATIVNGSIRIGDFAFIKYLRLVNITFHTAIP